jgi:hypothetical protein
MIVFLNRDELTRFVSEKRSLTVLKVDRCGSLGFLNISSPSLTTLWLSDLSPLTKSVSEHAFTIASSYILISCSIN